MSDGGRFIDRDVKTGLLKTGLHGGIGNPFPQQAQHGFGSDLEGLTVKGFEIARLERSRHRKMDWTELNVEQAVLLSNNVEPVQRPKVRGCLPDKA